MIHTDSLPRKLATRYIDFLLRYRMAILIVVVLCTVFSIVSMKNLVMDNSNEAFFREGDPTILALEKYRKNFGNEDTVVIAVQTEDVFTSQMMRRLEELADAFEKKVPYVDRVTWLGNVEYLSGSDNELVTGDLSSGKDGKKKDVQTLKHDAMAEEDYRNNVISADGKIAVLVLEFKQYPEDVQDPRKKIFPAVRSIVNADPFKDLVTAIVGAPVEDSEYDRISASESMKLGLLCLVVQFLLLLRIGRSLKIVLTPICVTFLSLVLTTGIISLAGWPLSMMVIMLPAMLFCVCIGDTIHIISDYQFHRGKKLGRREALIQTFCEVTKPCVLTTVTTALGFLSFLATDITPIRLAGLFSAIGAVMALALSLVLTPIFLASGKEQEDRARTTSKQHREFRRVIFGLTTYSLNHPWKTICGFGLLTVVSIISFQQVVVETSLIHDMSTKLDVRRDYDFFDTALGGAMSLEIILDTGAADQVRKIETIRDMEKIQEYIDRQPLVKKTHSLVNIMKRLRFVLHNEDPRFRSLPETQPQFSEYLFLYETSGGRNLDKELSFRSDVTRIHVQTRTVGTAEVKQFMNGIDAFIKTHCSTPFKVDYAGQMPWIAALSDYVVEGQITSLLMAVLTITVTMSLLLGSLRLGLISMIPNIIPVLFPLGLMGVIGVNMSISLMIFSCVIMGVAVDDTIYFYVHFKEKWQRFKGDYRKTAMRTAQAVAVPAVFTTVSLAMGFSLFTLSTIRTSSEFGYLGGLAFVCALLADIMLSPALMIVLKPMKK